MVYSQPHGYSVNRGSIRAALSKASSDSSVIPTSTSLVWIVAPCRSKAAQPTAADFPTHALPIEPHTALAASITPKSPLRRPCALQSVSPWAPPVMIPLAPDMIGECFGWLVVWCKRRWGGKMEGLLFCGGVLWLRCGGGWKEVWSGGVGLLFGKGVLWWRGCGDKRRCEARWFVCYLVGDNNCFAYVKEGEGK